MFYLEYLLLFSLKCASKKIEYLINGDHNYGARRAPRSPEGNNHWHPFGVPMEQENGVLITGWIDDTPQKQRETKQLTLRLFSLHVIIIFY